ncbi:sugar lactone lactonase YvrE [Halanaerobium saccharolyticum]|uniref:Regucalcin n=1 Tax=Halanaerobium saccharolyticum TaxID=43595 RepID=A0A4R7Z250_9FIRM|nr:SMP-30/gluconolactonase/LRE family protein [Halanaerobium saccharolyticum]RAK06938.1 sugar lactone lactonase YvrE [Halanaerobium saccharolyticum]TDW01665.1 sugar lactone lactonase YvrE [Halanaerobium saccharolyticum]TDX53063.1 sugar lactone lactonase YvrE [Halanaerobium saccharolyticum]
MKKINDRLDLILDAKAQIAEGPFWDQEEQVLYWVDILEKRINIYNPAAEENMVIQLEKMIGAIIPTTEKGKLLAALEDGIYLINSETAEAEFLVNSESNTAQTRFNDGKCDPKGRFWVGTMDLEENRELGTLYCLDQDLNLEEKIKNVKISNGLAWGLDNKTMYYIDSPTKEVLAFDYDLETAEISNKRSIISFAEGEGVPDGMTIDAQGKLWIAHFGGAQVSSWDPESGKKIDKVELPVLNVTSCAFGGKNWDELYITTASVGLSEEEKKRHPYAGGIFRYQAEVKGLEAVKFKLK